MIGFGALIGQTWSGSNGRRYGWLIVPLGSGPWLGSGQAAASGVNLLSPFTSKELPR
jgi:hypothetical protein